MVRATSKRVALPPCAQTALVVFENKHKRVPVDAVVEDLADAWVTLEAVQDLDLGVDIEEPAGLMRPLGHIHYLQPRPPPSMPLRCSSYLPLFPPPPFFLPNGVPAFLLTLGL